MNDASLNFRSISRSSQTDREDEDEDFRRTAVYRRNQGTHCRKLVVAVHGMGDQKRNDLAQTAGRLFARNAAADVPTQATHLPLGLWDASSHDHPPADGPVHDHAIGFVPRDPGVQLEEFAFAEIFWADLARDLEHQGYRLEESKRWATSVVDRLSQRHDLTKEFGAYGPQLAGTVIEEIAETVRLLEQVLWLTDKAGLLTFDLAHILESYLADVQQVVDFRGQRARFLERFLKRMARLKELCPEVEEIHIVAHSEGTVLAFLTLLTALWDESQFQPPNRAGYDPKRHAAPHAFDISACDMSWIHKVRSFTTLGSPIDKHLILFPNMWYRFSGGKGTWKPLDPDKSPAEQPQIRWRNYYDLADPVGYDLNTARQTLVTWECPAFDFKGTDDDHGFRRYPLPGKAHVDYFGDDGLFSHIINSAIKGESPPGKEGPANRWRGQIAWYLPFVLVVILHLAAVFILHQAVMGSPAESSSSVNAGAFTAVGETALVIGTCSWLLLGTTVVTRLFRITRDRRARALGVACFLGGAIAFCSWPGHYTLQVVSNLIPDTIEGSGQQQFAVLRGVYIGFAVFVWIWSWAVDRFRLRNRLSPIWGLRWMIFLGGIPLCGLFIGAQIFNPNNETSTLAVLLGAAAFLYLWWLAALIFDLAFCWAWYISTSNSLLSRVNRLPLLEPQAGPPETTQPAESAS